MNKEKCSVCGKPLALDKEKTYIVKDVFSLQGKRLLLMQLIVKNVVARTF